MNAVLEYKQRRKKRLDAKAVERYKMRRDERLLSRYDDDDDANNGNGGGKRGGGHGNVRIPFGLCQREGIQIDPKWTPKDAWEALAGKGYSAGEVYEELKKTGKIGSKKTKKAPTKLTESHFPEGMLGSSKKNTMEFAKYLNENCKDAEITEFLSLGSSPNAKTAPNIKCKRIKTGGSKISYAFKFGVDNDELQSVEVVIPQITTVKDASIKKSKIATFAHEWTHYIDLVSRSSGKEMHSETFPKLTDAINANDSMSIGEEVKAKIDAFNKEYESEQRRCQDELNGVRQQVTKEMYGDSRPRWLREDGGIDYRYYRYSDTAVLHEYRKACNKREEEIKAASNEKRRALMGGISSLQGIYDSLSGGRLRANGTVKYGHSLEYFKREPGNRNAEALADYVALRVTNPELADLFRKDKPEIAKAMDDTIANIVKQLRGA